ncbi:MAG TPA: glycosyltransferase family 2 protein [Dehalococcoidia bacterium]
MSTEASPAADPDTIPLVYSIILTYNNFDDTDECVASVLAQDYTNQRVIIVDNHSTDGSGERLRRKWLGHADVIDSGANRGVPGGYNAGIEAALAAGADYCVVFNNDIALAPDFTSALVSLFAAKSDIGIAAPLTTYYDDPGRVWFARIQFDSWFGITRNRYRGQRLSEVPASPQVQDCDYVLTHATMISRRALEAAGLPDERFFYGHDDVDYSLRLRAKGMRCVSLMRPLVRHKVSITAGFRGSGALRPAAAYTYGLGSVLVGAKHFSGIRAPTFLATLLALRAPYTMLTFLMAGRPASAFAYLRGLAAGIRQYGAAFVTGTEAHAS